MTTDPAQRARAIIAEIPYLTIATATKEGSPWNSPVYTAYDEQYNFYWVSSPKAQHSKNIAENDRIFIVIYNSSAAEGTGEGVYIAARAFTLTDADEITRALQLHSKRKGAGKEPRPAADFLGPKPRRVYKAVPEKFWINTGERIDGHYVDARVEIDGAML